VTGTVRRDDPAVILYIGDPVSDPLSKKIGELPASFFENDLRSTCVPEFRSRRKVDVKITRPFGDEPDL
jgi:hypothetical protein